MANLLFADDNYTLEIELSCTLPGNVFVSINGHCVTVQDIIINILIFTTGFAICLLNAWILHILTTNDERSDISYSILVHLSAADMLTGIFLVYDSVYNILQYEIYTECVIRIGIFIAVNLASVLSLVVLTFDRFLKIYDPYAYIKHITTRKLVFVESLAWTVSIIVGSLPFFGWSTEDILHICDFFTIIDEYYLILILVLFSLPFLVMVGAYTVIIRIVMKHKEFSGNMRGKTTGKILKTIKTSGIIVGAYFGCWIPVGTFTLIVITTDIEKNLPSAWSENVIFTYLLLLGIFNSILNPIIYYRNVGIVRKAMGKLRCLKCCSRRLRTLSVTHSDVRMRSFEMQSNCKTTVTRSSNRCYHTGSVK